uniref:Uncharacterized protein n=1 Tax=Lepeophtheirus salmonis TaxID=72036 RepID=A0A0K2TMJ3_LEPSM
MFRHLMVKCILSGLVKKPFTKINITLFNWLRSN